MNLSNENVIHIKNGDIEYLQFKKLLEFKNIKHAYSLKPLDFRTHDNNDAMNSYKILLEEMNIDPETLIKPIQKHTDNIVTINEKDATDVQDTKLLKLEQTDGIITNKKDITLATTNADCVLMLFYDPSNDVIANIHAGWRGTFKKIAKRTVQKMVNEFKCNPSNIMVFISPSIRACHFEVDEDVKKECDEIFAYTKRLDEIIKIGDKKERQTKVFYRQYFD